MLHNTAALKQIRRSLGIGAVTALCVNGAWAAAQNYPLYIGTALLVGNSPSAVSVADLGNGHPQPRGLPTLK